MINRDIIENIHATNLYGSFIETGAGNGIANTLLNVPGASQTVYKAFQPYSKELQINLYGNFGRSVSKEFCASVIRREIVENLNVKNFNFVFVSTWQISSDPKVITHGWFGLCKLGSLDVNFLHFKMKNSTGLSRHEITETITELGLKLISNIANDIPMNTIVSDDFILDMAFENSEIGYKDGEYKPMYDLLLNSLNDSKDDYFLSFIFGEPRRFEELLRNKKDIVILKGSFDPLHHQHTKMLDVSIGMYEESHGFFLISLDRYDKPHIPNEEAIQRILNFASTGYVLVLCKEIFFYNTFKMLYKYDNNFYFPIGFDTMNRIFQTDYENHGCNGIEDFIYETTSFFKNFKLILFPRNNVELDRNVLSYNNMIQIVDSTLYVDDGTSSTKIRNKEIKNLLDEQNSETV